MAGYTIPDERDEIIRDLVRGLKKLRSVANIMMVRDGLGDRDRAAAMEGTDELIARARKHLEGKQ